MLVSFATRKDFWSLEELVYLHQYFAGKGNIPDEGRLGVFHFDNWSEGNEKVDPLFPIIVIGGQRIKHLSRSLGMTNISQFLNPSSFQNIIDLRRCIKIS